MIRGVTATVTRPTATTAKDRFGNVVYGTTTDTVENVLVAPSNTFDLEAARPLGESMTLALHFPKGYDENLEDATITLPAPWLGPWKVSGKPMPYIDENTPTPWHMPVTVEAANG